MEEIWKPVAVKGFESKYEVVRKDISVHRLVALIFLTLMD